MNPTAGQVAAELRRVADALDKEPEAVISTPWLSFYCNNYSLPEKGKLAFLALARILPRPLTKKMSDNYMELEAISDTLRLAVQINRSAVCTLVEPAKPAVYHCEPLLSVEEEAQIEGTAI